jgi:dinuclear metal center YbgI/SA1388 family protein
MLIRDLVAAMQAMAPVELAEAWDNAGLVVGSREAPLAGPVLLTIDLTKPVLDEGVAAGAGAIVAYHPPIFEPLRRLTDESPKQRVILEAIRAGLAIYSPHTALDAATGGMAEWLCEGVSGAPSTAQEQRIRGDCRAIRPHPHLDPRQEVKIVTFVPELKLDDVRAALATAGAGLIGHYMLCSFAAPGVGTFLGDDQSNPTVGRAGRLERVTEYRLEMVCAKSSLAIALETLRRFHPYEAPAVDIFELQPQPQRSQGLGRRVVLDEAISLEALGERVRAFLGIPSVRVAPAPDAKGTVNHAQMVTRVGVCPGSGAELAPLARGDGCEVYVTGEMGHHQVLAALDSGMSVILAGHTNTERGYLPRLAGRLEKALPGVKAMVSRMDKSPFAAG